MGKHTVLLLMVCLALAVPAGAEIVSSVEVTEIDSIAVQSSYNAATGQLVWTRGGIATVYSDLGTYNFRVNVNAVLDDVTDTSAGGLASASFASGDFTVTVFAMADPGKTNPLGSLAGEIYPGWEYKEGETQPGQLYGSAPVRLTSWDFGDYEWAEGLGAMGGLTATTTNLFNPVTLGNISDLSDYQSDWSSKNTIVTLLADESGIPEPATITLLGLGAFSLLSRKRS